MTDCVWERNILKKEYFIRSIKWTGNLLIRQTAPIILGEMKLTWRSAGLHKKWRRSGKFVFSLVALHIKYMIQAPLPSFVLIAPWIKRRQALISSTKNTFDLSP
jgi:hypothetical protein